MSNQTITKELEARLGPLVTSGDPAAVAELLAASEGLLQYYVRRFARVHEVLEDLEDLRQEGLIALWAATKTWDHERGRWNSYVVPRVRGALMECVRHSAAVTIPQEVNKARAQRATGVEPTGSMVGRLADADAVDFAASLDATDENGSSLGEKLTSHVSVEGEAERRALLAAVETAIAGLTEKQQQVIRWRFTEDMTFAEIGERLGTGRSAVSKLTDRILAALGEHLSDWAA